METGIKIPLLWRGCNLKRAAKAARNKQALTLIELLVTVVILSIFVGGGLTGFDIMRRLTQRDSNRLEALYYASSTLERLLIQNYSSVPDNGQSQPDPLPSGKLKDTFNGNRTYVGEKYPAAPNPQQGKKLTATVSWQEGSESRSVNLVTMYGDPG